MFINSPFVYPALQNNTSITRKSEGHCMLLEHLNEQQHCKKELDLSDTSHGISDSDPVMMPVIF